jgi:hypothetical protein
VCIAWYFEKIPSSNVTISDGVFYQNKVGAYEEPCVDVEKKSLTSFWYSSCLAVTMFSLRRKLPTLIELIRCFVVGVVDGL